MTQNLINDRNCDLNNFKKVRYFHGMLMTDRDFREEQIYHNEKRKLLNKMLHGWGVVCGLSLSGKAGESIITISPGMGLDCHGNEIVVCEPYKIDLRSKTCFCILPTKSESLTGADCLEGEPEPKTWFIGIKFHEMFTDPMPVYVPGGECEEKTCESSRISEGFCIKIFDQPPIQPRRSQIDPSLIERIFDCEEEVITGTVDEVLENKDQIKLFDNASKEDDFYNGMKIKITSGTGSKQSRRIIDYKSGSGIATLDRNYDTPPDTTSHYSITKLKEECYREKVEEFTKNFCTSVECPDPCPEEHYIILGKIEIDAATKVIKNIDVNEGRSYLMTFRLFQYIFSSALTGLDTLFTPDNDQIPDINLIHTNPIAALCWIGQMFIEKSEIGNKDEAPDKGMAKYLLNAFTQGAVETELKNLRKEVNELKEMNKKKKKNS